MNPPDNLPPLPPVPDGYDRWEYRGIGWRNSSVAHFASAWVTPIQGRTHEWYDECHSDANGYDDTHYIEAVRDADATMNPMPDDINIAVSESLFALLDPENSEDLDQPATGVAAVCHCRDCNPSAWWMICCSKCGNKRCPHALHHRNECTNSNSSGQHIEHTPRPMTLRDTALGVEITQPTGVEAREIPAATLKAPPVGYLPNHTPESIPERVADLVTRYAKAERERDEYAKTLRVIAESNDRSHHETAYSAFIRERHPEIVGNAKPHATGPAGEMP